VGGDGYLRVDQGVQREGGKGRVAGLGRSVRELVDPGWIWRGAWGVQVKGKGKGAGADADAGVIWKGERVCWG
jgi:hypothetical protein